MNIVLSSIGALKNKKESAHITLFLLAKELQRLGHDIRIVAKGKGRDTLEGIPIHRTSLLKIPFLLRRLNQEKKIDVIHSFSASPLFLLPHLLAPGKKIHTLKSYSRSKMGRRGVFLVKLAGAVTVPTKVHAQRWGIKKYEILHSPIDTAKFKPLDKKNLKNKYGYEKRKIILYYGALWKEKGVDILIRAMPKIIEKEKKVLLLILPRYTRITPQQELVDQLKMRDKVKFITEDVAIEEYVNVADVVALPYLNLSGTEGNPSCMLEAMACKTAVITSDLPELREIAEGSVEFVEAGRVKELAEKIVMVLKQQEQQKIENAFEKAQEFESKKIAQNFSDLYTSVSTNSYTGNP